MRTCGDGGAPPSLVFGTAPRGRQSGRAPLLTRAWALSEQLTRSSRAPALPASPGGMEAGRRPSSPSSTVLAGTCSLAGPADLSKTGPIGTATPGQFLESLSSLLFILLSAKE